MCAYAGISEKMSVNIDRISANISYFDLNQIQLLELNHNGFLTIQ